jgi:hypothetical protein
VNRVWGYRLAVRSRVKAKPEDLPRLKDLAYYSPVFNTITRGANVEVDVALK